MTEERSKKAKNRIILAAVIIFALLCVPFRVTKGTENIHVFGNGGLRSHMLIGTREQQCSEGFTVQAALWEYRSQCRTDFDDRHHMENIVLIFRCIGGASGEHD